MTSLSSQIRQKQSSCPPLKISMLSPSDEHPILLCSKDSYRHRGRSCKETKSSRSKNISIFPILLLDHRTRQQYHRFVPLFLFVPFINHATPFDVATFFVFKTVIILASIRTLYLYIWRKQWHALWWY